MTQRYTAIRNILRPSVKWYQQILIITSNYVRIQMISIIGMNFKYHVMHKT